MHLTIEFQLIISKGMNAYRRRQTNNMKKIGQFIFGERKLKNSLDNCINSVVMNNISIQWPLYYMFLL